ncbi:hypothetical protein H1D62_004905 [Salmonella enterica]|nr:hypothetical protein [Salmonella enterica]
MLMSPVMWLSFIMVMKPSKTLLPCVSNAVAAELQAYTDRRMGGTACSAMRWPPCSAI